jgi:hypothetical protein
MDNIKKGDWVRFMQDGKLIIGVVQYLIPASTDVYYDEVVTDAGIVQERHILEVR